MYRDFLSLNFSNSRMKSVAGDKKFEERGGSELKMEQMAQKYEIIIDKSYQRKTNKSTFMKTNFSYSGSI